MAIALSGGMMNKATTLLLSLGLLTAACGSDVTAGDPTDPTTNPEAVERVAGTYEVTSDYSLTQNPELDAKLRGTIDPLSNFAEKPFRAIADVACAQSPDIQKVLCPSGAVAKIAANLAIGVVDGLIRDKVIDGKPVVLEVLQVVDDIATMADKFQLVTSLTVGNAGETGNALANHQIVAIKFRKDADTPGEFEDILVKIDPIAAQVATARDVDVNIDTNTGVMSFGQHEMRMPLGNLLVGAVNAFVEKKVPGATNLGSAFRKLVPCDEILAGKEGLLADIGGALAGTACNLGLDMLGVMVEDKLREIDNATITMLGGEGTVKIGVEGIGKDKVNTMTGSWDVSFALNENGVPFPSTFNAIRTSN